MIRQLLICSFLILFSSSSYLPMSYKKHNFGDNVCNYYDMEDLINYVKPCETGYYCQDTESSANGADSQHKLHTCQKYMKIPANPSTPLKGKDEECNNNAECGFGLTCITIGSETKTKCNIVCPTDQKSYVINGNYECRYEAYKDMCQFTKDSTIQNYPNRNKCKTCGLIHFDEKKDGSQKIYYVMNSVDETDLYSQPDNTPVLEEDACQSGTALYFYGDGSTKNNIDTAHANENKLYLKCVTIKAVDHDSKRFNYTIGDDTIHIYDINNVDYDDLVGVNSQKKNELKGLCSKYLMTKIGLWNDNKEEYIKYLKCEEDNQADDNLKRKIYYLKYPEIYLLYKDQTEVIEYLIQKKYHDIVPIIKAKEEEGAGFLNSKYLILSLLLFL